MTKKQTFLFLALLSIGAWILLAFAKSPEKISIKNEDSATKGLSGAPITIVEYSNFGCKACKDATEVIDKILDKYGDKIYFIFRTYPFLRKHSNIDPSAVAAECAREQSKFWAYHDYLFKNQYDWAKDPLKKPLDDPMNKFSIYADRLGLDIEAFNKCLISERAKQVIIASRAEAKSLKVQSTPTFFINGKRVVGIRSLKAKYDQIIQEALKE